MTALQMADVVYSQGLILVMMSKTSFMTRAVYLRQIGEETDSKSSAKTSNKRVEMNCA